MRDSTVPDLRAAAREGQLGSASERRRREPSDAPLELDVGAPRARRDLQVVAVLAEEVVRLEELLPGRRPDKDPVDDLSGCGRDRVGESALSRRARRRSMGGDAPRLNSAVMICCVLRVTLWVEHMDGYAGVMIGMRCERSCG